MLTIRLARLEDAEAITKINIDTWRSNYAGIVPDEYLSDLSYNKELYERVISNPDNLTYIAEYNGVVVGYICSGVDTAHDKVASSKLRMAYVRKEYQNQGIGKKLFLQIAEHLHKSGHNALSANTFAGADSNFFYSSLGGIICKKNVENIGRKDIDTITYLFNLPIRL